MPMGSISQEIAMGFMKTGVSITPPKPVNVTASLQPGDMRDGKVWDGEKWVSETEWKSRDSKKEQSA